MLLVLAAVFYFFFVNKSGGGNNSEVDAKRFARLLVSEIKLYNEQKVQRALQNKNLSEALRDEIGQAQKTYQNRFPGAEDAAHFERALIEILADGDPSKMDSEVKSSLR